MYPRQALPIAILIVFALLMFSKQGYSQNQATNQVWFDFNPNYELSDKFELVTKVGIEAAIPDVWYKYYVNGEVDYKIPKFLIKKLEHAEAVYTGTSLYYNENIGQPNSVELSPYQGYMLKWPNRKQFSLENKVELTERFQWEIDEVDYSFGLQLSYEGIIDINFPGKVWKTSKKIYLTGNVKFWWNLLEANTFNDVARLMPGLGYHFNAAWKAAFLVGWKYSKNQPDEQFSNNNIIYRLRVYYTIPKKK